MVFENVLNVTLYKYLQIKRILNIQRKYLSVMLKLILKKLNVYCSKYVNET